MNIKDVLKAMVQLRSSDLFLKVGSPPRVRVDGAVRQLGTVSMSANDMRDAFTLIIQESARETFKKNHECDTAFEDPEIGRFRVNAFMQRGQIGIVLRHVKGDIPTFKDLGLPVDTFERLSLLKRGLVLVTGITGSGKSTTLASMISYMNASVNRHIITVEDPIEYSYKDDRCLINQREVGIDTRDFKSALRNAMREAPDVILIGEMRDEETVQTALSAAETGHLVFSTVHTVDAAETVNRLIEFFPPHMHNQVRAMIAGTLKGAVSQRLVPTSDGKGRVAVCEVLRMTGRVKDMIMDPQQTGRLPEVIADGGYYGMQTFDQALFHHLKAGRITMDEAMNFASSPHDFKLLVASDGRKGTTMDDLTQAEDQRSAPAQGSALR